MRFSLALLQPCVAGGAPAFRAIVHCPGRFLADRVSARKQDPAGMQVAPPRGRPYVVPLNPAPRRPIPMTNLSKRQRLASTTLTVATILCGGISVIPAAAQAQAP